MKKIIILMLGIVLFFTACSKNTEQTKNEGDILRIALSEDAKNIDTVQINDDYAVNIINQVYDTLVELKPDGTVVNSLAEKIENPDPQTFIITLRSGVKFSNGDDLTLDDVIFSLERAAESDQFKTFYGKIDKNSYKKIDDRTLQFKLKEKDATFLKALSHPAVSILSKKFVENGGNLTTDALGTGAYVLDEWVPNDHANFSYNKYYWADEPKYKNIEMRVIPEASQRLIEVESAGMDLALKIEPNDIKSIEENEDLKLLKKIDNSVHFIGFNMLKTPFDNKLAREAMVNAIDMDSIFKTVYLNSGTLASSPVNPNFKYSISDELKPYKNNMEKAKDLFAKANINEGSEFTIYVSDNQTRVNVATMMQDQLKNYGINLKIVRLEWGAFMDALKNGEHNMFIMSWNPSIIDTHYELYQPFHSDNKGIGPNFTFYSNKDLDNLIEQGIQIVDDNQRKEIYGKAQKLIYEEKPWMYICYGETLMAASKDFPDFDMEAGYAQKFKNIR